MQAMGYTPKGAALPSPAVLLNAPLTARSYVGFFCTGSIPHIARAEHMSPPNGPLLQPYHGDIRARPRKPDALLAWRGAKGLEMANSQQAAGRIIGRQPRTYLAHRLENQEAHKPCQDSL